jgi:hypothetical protein
MAAVASNIELAMSLVTAYLTPQGRPVDMGPLTALAERVHVPRGLPPPRPHLPSAATAASAAVVAKEPPPPPPPPFILTLDVFYALGLVGTGFSDNPEAEPLASRSVALLNELLDSPHLASAVRAHLAV